MAKLKIALSVVAIAFLMASAILYFVGSPYYGYVLDVAIPLCLIALYLSLKQKKNSKLTPFLILLMFMISFASAPSPAHAEIYQGSGYVGWIWPDGGAWAMVDTVAQNLSFTWSFSWYIILPWPGIYLPVSAWSYIQISDDSGTIYCRHALTERIPTVGEVHMAYNRSNTWVTFVIQVTYQLVSPSPAFLTPGIAIRFFIGTLPPRLGGGIGRRGCLI